MGRTFMTIARGALPLRGGRMDYAYGHRFLSCIRVACLRDQCTIVATQPGAFCCMLGMYHHLCASEMLDMVLHTYIT